MRLLVSIIKFEQGWGGAPESIRLLARQLAPYGVECDVVTSRGFRDNIARFELLPPPASETRELQFKELGHYDAFLIAGPWQPFMRIRRILQGVSRSAKVIYLPRGGLALDEFRRLRDIKKLPYLALLEMRLIERSNAIVFSSEIEDLRSTLIGRQPRKRVIIPDFVEAIPFKDRKQETYHDPSKQLTLTFLAEAAPRKGLLRFLLGLRGALSEKAIAPDLRVTVNVGGSVRPGSEWYHGRCEAIAASLPITVNFIGSVPHDQRANLYANTDLFVAPSSFESFGLTLIEALSAGCPILTTPKLGVLEYLPSSPHITISRDASAGALSEALRLAIKKRQAARPDAGKIRLLCNAAIEEINRDAVQKWQGLLGRH